MRLLLVLLLICQPVLASPHQTAKALNEKFTQYLKSAGQKDFSGTVMLIQDNEIIFEGGYGYANREQKLENGTDVLYDFGSLTKQFTATAIMKLVEQEKLNLDDTLDRFFEHVPVDKAKITVHQLLSHSAGISGYTGDDFTIINTSELLEEVFERQLNNTPGEAFEYANYGYSLLGGIIEQITGTEYERFLQEEILKPAGLNHSGYLGFDSHELDVAHGYQFATGSDWGTSMARYQAQGVSWNLKANGGVLSTLQELQQWLTALREQKVITKGSLDLMQQPHIPVKKGMGYGYGWRHTTTSNGNRLVFHGGSNTIFLSAILWFPDLQNTQLLFVSNEQHPEVIKLIRELRSMIDDPNYLPQDYEQPGWFSRVLGLFN